MATTAVKTMMWLEPAFFKKQEYGYKWPPTYAHVIFGAITFLFTILPWIVPPKDGLASYLGLPVMGLVIGALGGYGLSLYDLNSPANVIVEAAGVTRMDSWLGFGIPILFLLRYRMRTWSWHQIETAQLDPSTDKRLIYVITLFDKNHSVLGRIGVPPKVDLEATRTVFLKKDKALQEPVASV